MNLNQTGFATFAIRPAVWLAPPQDAEYIVIFDAMNAEETQASQVNGSGSAASDQTRVLKASESAPGEGEGCKAWPRGKESRGGRCYLEAVGAWLMYHRGKTLSKEFLKNHLLSDSVLFPWRCGTVGKYIVKGFSLGYFYFEGGGRSRTQR